MYMRASPDDRCQLPIFLGISACYSEYQLYLHLVTQLAVGRASHRTDQQLYGQTKARHS